MPSDYEAIRTQHLEDYGHKKDWRQSVLTDRYGERTHFLFELLQNAEDAGATRVEFRLFDDRLEIRHDGRDFDTRDVKAICAIDESTKPDDEGMIGRFGVGFKSVYAFTTAPQVHCPGSDEHFEIRHHVEPWAHRPRKPGMGWTTLFVLPFDYPKVPAEQAVEEIAEGLASLNPRTVLFLQHLLELRWKAPGSAGAIRRDEAVHGGARRVRLFSDASASEEWLVFERSVRVAEGRGPGRVEVAFLVAADDEGSEQIVNAHDTELVAFFPTARETHLGFLLQAPFVLTPARDNVRERHPVNDLLARAAGDLLVEALEEIRDRGLLEVNVLEGLPIDIDAFPEGSLLRPLYEAVREALLAKPLLPTADGRYLSAPKVRIASSAGMRELISPRQLGALLGLEGEVAWASPEITSDRTPDLFQYLNGYKPYLEPAVPGLVPGMALAADVVVRRLTSDFMKGQTDDWVIRLYQWLGQRVVQGVRRLDIVRTEEGNHVAAQAADGNLQVWLPPKGDTTYPVVRRKIARATRATAFFEQLGLTEPDVVDEVLTTVLPKYASEKKQDKSYAADLERIAHAIRVASGDKRTRLFGELEELEFLICRNAASGEKQWGHAAALYEPTETLMTFFEGNDGAWFLDAECLSHVDCWRELGLDSDFHVTRTDPDRRGYVVVASSHGRHRRGRNRFDPDLSIHGLAHAVEHPNRERSLVVWNLLSRLNTPLSGVVESSSRKDYSNSSHSRSISEVGRLTASHGWLLDRAGNWKVPSEVSLDDLAPEYSRDETLAKRLGMRPTVVREAAELLEIEPDELDLLRMHPELVREAVQSARLKHAASVADGADDKKVADPKPGDVVEAFRQAFDRPGQTEVADSSDDGQAGDPARRRQRVRETIEEARAAEPPRDQRWRIVPRKEWEARDPSVREYLLRTYGGRCQICGATFVRRDGKPYFEAKYLVSPTVARWTDANGNALCLCPTCLAKLLHGSVDGPDVLDQVNDLAEDADALVDGASIQFELCGESAEIRFAQRHLIDTCALLAAAQAGAGDSGDAQ